MKKRYWIAGVSGLATAAAVAKLLSRPRDVDWEKNREVVFHAEYSRFAEVDGVRVHYQDAGDESAPTIILIHGFLSSTFVWSKVFLELAATGYRVIAPDLLGYGYSAKPQSLDYTIASQARMLAGLMDHLELGRVNLVGSSYGGAVAATLALDCPERVGRLVLVSAVTNNEPTKYMIMRLVNAPILGDILAPFLAGSRRLIRGRMKEVYDRHSWVLDERRVDARYLPLRAAATHRAIIRTVRHWDTDRIQREAHLITQPTLILWGDKDRDVPLHDGEELQQTMKDARLIVFRNCGHHPHEEFPHVFTELVADFCSDQVSGESVVRAV
ncbi:MAG: alpha/beta hydrolase [Acidobacteriota bacterium]